MRERQLWREGENELVREMLNKDEAGRTSQKEKDSERGNEYVKERQGV
tara:strand:+ start:455 stop:598 length:144 start_codon:yes stop_codon:yes gene_type:complete